MKNHDFETDWKEIKSHECLVVTEDQTFTKQVGNIFTPPGWVTWYYHPTDGKFAQPEVRETHKENDSDRVYSGQKGMLLFTFSRRHDAGFYQQIQVDVGSKIEFFAHAHAWSNHKDESQPDKFPHPDDGNWSEGPGYEAGYLLEGDAPNDEWRNFTFCVGIDPYGGTNPMAESVIWGRGAHIYNKYAPVPSVKATAEYGVVTLFLRSKTLWPFKHNDAYWDLCKVSIEKPRGHPRVQYPRVYVLLFPSANAEWVKAVIDATWNDKRYTFGASADDAGIGDLNEKEVIAINPQMWEGETLLEDFYTRYYPGVVFTPIKANTPNDLERKLLEHLGKVDPVLLGQADQPWGPKRYAQGRCGTFAALGCWITDCAMAMRYLEIDKNATPLTVDEIVGSSGYTDDCLMKWSAMESLGLDVLASTKSEDVVREHLKSGGVAFAEVSPVDFQHFVMVVSYDGQHYEMYDPLKIVHGNLDDYYGGVDSWRLIRKKKQPVLQLHPINGLHDIAGAEWMLKNGVKGWCCEPLYLGESGQSHDYRKYAENGIRIIANPRYSYAIDDEGGQGTMPPISKLPAFEQAVIDTMTNTRGAWGWVYGNEMNNPREFPHDYTLTPSYYLMSYNRIWQKRPLDQDRDENKRVRMSPGAIDPFNPGWGDWRVSWGEVLKLLLGADFIALHSYSHGIDFDPDMVFGDDPLKGVYYNLRVLESQKATIPARFRELPILVTETNHIFTDDKKIGWQNSGTWLQKALMYFAYQGVAGVCAFRYNFNQWKIQDKQQILDVLKHPLIPS